MARRARVPDGMPPAPEEKGASREILAAWLRDRVMQIEREYEERLERMRNGEEHPLPIYQRMARTLGALGLSPGLAATRMGISVANLKTYYQEDYDVGHADQIVEVAANALRIATSTTDPGAAKVAMDVLARRGGDEWRPPAQKVEMKNDNDAPPIIDSSKLSFEDRAQLRQILERAAAGGSAEPEDEPAMIGEISTGGLAGAE